MGSKAMYGFNSMEPSIKVNEKIKMTRLKLTKPS